MRLGYAEPITQDFQRFGRCADGCYLRFIEFRPSVPDTLRSGVF